MSQSDVVDLLGGRSLNTLVNSDFLDRFGLLVPEQYGVVCGDMPGKITELESLGCTPFMHVKKQKVPSWAEYGVEKKVQIEMAMGYTEDGRDQIELISPIKNAEIFQDVLPEDGSLTLHHVCSFQNDLVEASKKLEEGGCPLVVKGSVNAGIMTVDYVYHDTRDELGFYFEVAQYRFFGRHTPPTESLITRFARMQRWFS